MSFISLDSPSLSPYQCLCPQQYNLAFLKRDELDVEASISDDVDGKIADTQEDMWLTFLRVDHCCGMVPKKKWLTCKYMERKIPCIY